MANVDSPFFSRTDVENRERIVNILFSKLVERRAIVYVGQGQTLALSAVRGAVSPTISLLYSVFNETCSAIKLSPMLDTVLSAYVRVVHRRAPEDLDEEETAQDQETLVTALGKMLSEKTTRRALLAVDKSLSPSDTSDVVIAQSIINRLELMFVNSRVQVTFLEPSGQMRDAYYELDSHGKAVREITREEHDRIVREARGTNIESAGIDSDGGHVFFTGKGTVLRRDPAPGSQVDEIERDDFDLDSLSHYTPTRADEEEVREFMLADIVGTKRVPVSKPTRITGTATQLTNDTIEVDKRKILLSSLTPGESLLPAGSQYALLPAVEDIFLELARVLAGEFQSIFTDAGVNSAQLRSVISSLSASTPERQQRR